MSTRRTIVLALVALAGCASAGCSQSCEGSNFGTLVVHNDAPGAGPLIVRVSVTDGELLPVAGSNDAILPGDSVRFEVEADVYTVTVIWDGGGTSSREVEVDPTPDGYELDLSFLFDDDEDEEEEEGAWEPHGPLPDCPLATTGVDFSPP